MSTPSETRLQTTALATLAVLAVGFALWWLQPVLIPFVLAIMLTYVLEPIARFLVEKGRFPRLLAIPAALFVGFSAITLVGALISNSVAGMAGYASQYQATLTALAARVSVLLQDAGFEFGAEALQVQLANLPIGSTIMSATGMVLDLLSNTFLVLLFAVYLLMGSSLQRSTQRDGMWGKIDDRVRRYIVTKVLLSALTGLAVALILWLLGINLALVFGLLAFLLNFIPNIGSIIATLLPLPMVLVQPDATPLTMSLALILPGVVQMTVGNVVEPKLIGDALELHPITVLLALIVWGMLWGGVGMVLAAPLTAIIKILLDGGEHTRPLARLLAGDLTDLREM